MANDHAETPACGTPTNADENGPVTKEAGRDYPRKRSRPADEQRSPEAPTGTDT